MLKLFKWLILAILCAGLVVVGVANMTPVDLRLLPEGVIATEFVLRGIPIAAVILVSILIGIVIGEAFEWSREREYRRMAAQRRREIDRLKTENARLRHRVNDGKDELPSIAAQ